MHGGVSALFLNFKPRVSKLLLKRMKEGENEGPVKQGGGGGNRKRQNETESNHRTTDSIFVKKIIKKYF